MINIKKSKPVKLSGPIAIGVIAYASVQGAIAQEIDRVTVFSGEMRRSINDGIAENLGTTDTLNLGTDEGRRGQLTGGRRGVDEAQQSNTARQDATVPRPTRSQQRAVPVAAQTPIVNPASTNDEPRHNLPAEPVQTGTGVIDDDDPFDATGFRLGIFEGNLALEQSIGYSSNVSQSADGSGGGFSQTDVFFDLTSDWARHELRLDIAGSYRRPFDGDEIDQPSLNVSLAHRLDLIDGYTLTTQGFYSATNQSFTSTTLAPGAVDTPLFQNYGASVALRRDDRKVQYTLRGSIERETYEDADLGGGITESQSDLNNDEIGIALRVGYETSPAITPFIEGEYAIRNFEQQTDRNGNRRDSDIFTLRGGVEIDLGDKVQGEVAIGYVTERFDDAALDDLDGFTLDGTLQWSPERDTQISLTFGTETNTSIIANDNGSLIYNLRLLAERQITDRWAIDATLGYQLETNDDRNTTFEIGLGTEYWLNRFTALTGDIEYQSFTSDAGNSDFDDLGIRLGVRLQR